MRYKEFGKTGMKVSEMALGTWGIGGAGWDDNPEETRIDAICAAVKMVSILLIPHRPIMPVQPNVWWGRRSSRAERAKGS